jgi:hypothetical protein
MAAKAAPVISIAVITVFAFMGRLSYASINQYTKALGHSLARIRLRPAICNEIAVTEVNYFEIGYGKWE